MQGHYSLLLLHIQHWCQRHVFCSATAVGPLRSHAADLVLGFHSTCAQSHTTHGRQQTTGPIITRPMCMTGGSQAVMGTMVTTGSSSMQQVGGRSMAPSSPLGTQWVRDCTWAGRRSSSRECVQPTLWLFVGVYGGPQRGRQGVDPPRGAQPATVRSGPTRRTPGSGCCAPACLAWHSCCGLTCSSLCFPPAAFCSKNGTKLRTAFRNVNVEQLYPTVGLQR